MLPKGWTKGVRGKWLNFRKLAGNGTLLAAKLGSQLQHGGQMKSILDPSFRYRKSIETDLRKTFARVRRELRKKQQEQSTVGIGATRKVLPFRAR